MTLVTDVRVHGLGDPVPSGLFFVTFEGVRVSARWVGAAVSYRYRGEARVWCMAYPTLYPEGLPHEAGRCAVQPTSGRGLIHTGACPAFDDGEAEGLAAARWPMSADSRWFLSRLRRRLGVVDHGVSARAIRASQ